MAPPPEEPRLGTSGLQLPGEQQGQQGGGLGNGAWAKKHMGREHLQTHSSGESGGFFS